MQTRRASSLMFCVRAIAPSARGQISDGGERSGMRRPRTTMYRPETPPPQSPHHTGGRGSSDDPVVLQTLHHSIQGTWRDRESIS
jgi:hypothetical protein